VHLDLVCREQGDPTLRLAVRARPRTATLGHYSAGRNHVGVGDATAEGPPTGQPVAAVDDLQGAGRDDPPRRHRVQLVVDGPGIRLGQERPVVPAVRSDHGAPAGGGVCSGQRLQDPELGEQVHFGPAPGPGYGHPEHAAAAQRVDDRGRQPAGRLDLAGALA